MGGSFCEHRNRVIQTKRMIQYVITALSSAVIMILCVLFVCAADCRACNKQCNCTLASQDFTFVLVKSRLALEFFFSSRGLLKIRTHVAYVCIDWHHVCYDSEIMPCLLSALFFPRATAPVGNVSAAVNGPFISRAFEWPSRRLCGRTMCNGIRLFEPQTK
jgi:hypothetical protein